MTELPTPAELRALWSASIEAERALSRIQQAERSAREAARAAGELLERAESAAMDAAKRFEAALKSMEPPPEQSEAAGQWEDNQAYIHDMQERGRARREGRSVQEQILAGHAFRLQVGPESPGELASRVIGKALNRNIDRQMMGLTARPIPTDDEDDEPEGR